MARKILNRKELREEADSAERAEVQAEEGAPAPAAKTKEKKAPAKRKSRAKAAKEVRLKAFWGVFNQTLRRISLFDYNQRPEADKKAAELTESQKSPHFVQLVKEIIEE
jgi:hypothetical protein